MLELSEESNRKLTDSLKESIILYEKMLAEGTEKKEHILMTPVEDRR